MKHVKLLFVFALLVILAGCGGSGPPAVLSDIPVPPDVVVFEGAEENMLDTFTAVLQRAANTPPQQVEIRYYWAPETVVWEQVAQFYQTALAATGWEVEQERVAFDTAVWTYNGSAGKQTLVVSALPVAGSNGHILAVMLGGGN